MINLGYYNGKYGPLEEMTIPMNDRVCYFGDGVYDATYTANHTIFALDEHVDRLFRSMALIRIKPDKTKEEVKALLKEMVQKVESPDQFVYLQVTRGTAPRAHVFPEDVNPNWWITLTPGQLYDVSRPISCITKEDTRYFHCNIKTLNLLPSVLAAQEAKEHGCKEAILYRFGRVTECAHSNVSILKDGVFQTAPTDNLILPGITRKHLIELCGELGIPVREIPFSVKEMMEADEIIVSSSTIHGARVEKIDGIPVGGKAPELIKALQEAYHEKFRRETSI